MSFRDIKGQDSAVGLLKGTLESGRVAHAYIFFGPSGVGRSLTALNYAKALNCEAPAAADKPCDGCISCRKIDSRNHPDVFFLVPEKESTSIKIDGIREMIKSVGLKPYEAKKKVYIIDPADSMTDEAANALLKTLEEPASESVMILITANLKKIPATIASRSQVVKFFALKTGDVEDILKASCRLDGIKAHILAALSSGRLGEALKYNDAKLFDKRSKILDTLAGGAFLESDLDALPKTDLKLYLDIMLAWYRDVLVAKSGITGPEELINIDRRAEILSAAGRMRFDKLNSIIDEIIATGSFLDLNANPKLAMGVLGMKLQEA